MLKNIYEITKKLGIEDEYVEPYGKYKAKISPSINEKLKNNKDGKLVLVTAITPTKAGEGKTTMAIALADGLARINQKALLCLREPSLGPVFGVKGGATGGGLASVAPRDEINLHFTGDMHALTSSINLISAIIDNHIFQGNQLNIDPNKIIWKRAMDMNDRALREIEIAHGEKNGTVRKDGFVITVASEMMAILCLSTSEEDFMNKVNNIIVGFTYDDKPVYVRDFRISHAIMKLMREALKPNIVQTLENNPVLIHGGPFANIAHGCNSLFATKLALKLSPIVITEAGFAADLGAEKFMDICAREGKLHPDLSVVVATIKALKYHGGQPIENIDELNLKALEDGIENLQVHLENMKKYKVPVLVAINHFANDHQEEIDLLTKWCKSHHYEVTFVDSVIKGSEGAVDYANKVVKMLNEETSNYEPLYNVNDSITDKITKIVKEIYRADDVVFTPKALEQAKQYEQLGYGKTPVCIAKTPASISDDPTLIGVPKHFKVTIRELSLSAGAGFVVALAGKILTMPGLPKVPKAVVMEDYPIDHEFH